MLLFFTCRSSGSVFKNDIKYDQCELQQKNNQKKEVQDEGVVMNECQAYGRVQVRTDVIPSTSRDVIEVPRVYEAI